MLSIIVGIMFIVGGLSGEVVYRGNNSGGTLALIGFGLGFLGCVSGSKLDIKAMSDRQVYSWSEFRR